MLEKSNYKLNSTLPLAHGMINGQGCGEVSRFKYGLFHMSYNGCEIIAVCNLLKKLGREVPLAELANEIYPYGSVLWGLFGTNPYMLRRYFKAHGINVFRTTDYDEFCRVFGKAKYCVMSFWTGRNFLSSLHTVMLENRNGKITVYNRFNSKTCTYEFDGVQKFVKKRKFIIAFIAEEGDMTGEK